MDMISGRNRNRRWAGCPRVRSKGVMLCIYLGVDLVLPPRAPGYYAMKYAKIGFAKDGNLERAFPLVVCEALLEGP